MKLVAAYSSLLSDQMLRAYFSPAELEQIFENTSVNRIHDKLLGQIALKHTSTDTTFDKVIVDYNKLGQPVLPETPFQYCSISHSYGLAVAATSSEKIGVDVEKIRPHDKSLLVSIANEEEVRLFDGEDVEVIVTMIWVIKECVTKALGLGLAYPIRTLRMKKNGDEYLIKAGGLTWAIKTIYYNRYIIGYCYPADKKVTPTFEAKHIV